MTTVMNIPANMVTDESFSPEAGGSSQDLDWGRLVLDQAGTVMFAKGKLFPRELKPTDDIRFSHILVPDDVVSVVETGLLLKTYYLGIRSAGTGSDIKEVITGATYFLCSKRDAERFKAACDSITEGERLQEREEEERGQLEEYLDKLIIERCKATGRMDVAAVAEQNLDSIRRIEEMPGLSLAAATDFVSQHLQRFIIADVLTGLLDRETLQYVDRDLIIKEQRVVHVQLDFNELLQQLGSKGVALSSITCPRCGGGCSVPDSGTSFSCEFCGSTIHVMDIFETFKGILG